MGHCQWKILLIEEGFAGLAFFFLSVSFGLLLFFLRKLRSSKNM